MDTSIDDCFVLFHDAPLVVMACEGTGGLALKDVEKAYKNPGVEYAPVRHEEGREALYMQYIQPPFDLNIYQGKGESCFWAAGCSQEKMRLVLEELTRATFVTLRPATKQLVTGIAPSVEIESATMHMATQMAPLLGIPPEEAFCFIHYIRFARDYQQKKDALQVACKRFNVPERLMAGI